MRSIQMIETDLAALVVIDVQEKMLAAIGSDAPDDIVTRLTKLIGTARILEIPILLTEQYPAGLGSTDPRIRSAIGNAGPIVKNTCSSWRDGNFREALRKSGREHIIVCGLETHVCIQQTVLDLIRVDHVPFVPADACGSRFALDKNIALDRMRHAGAEVTSVESLIFELIERCDHPKFKDVLKCVK